MIGSTLNPELAKLIRNAKRGELNTIIELVKERQRSLAREEARTFEIGDKVTFDAKTRGIVEGIVTKINRKNLKVKQTNGLKLMWTVHPSLLKKSA